MITHLKFLEDGECLLVELGPDGDVGNIRGIVVVQPVDVLHHLAVIRLDGGQDEEVLQVPAENKNLNFSHYGTEPEPEPEP
jgi:hypothetical protein